MAASDAPPVVEDDDAPAPIKPRTQPHLMPQDAKTVDASKLTALTPEVVRLCGTWSLLVPILFVLLLGSGTWFIILPPLAIHLKHEITLQLTPALYPSTLSR